MLEKIFDNQDLLLSELNSKQKMAILAEDKYTLILAGAGSGKTKTLIQKINHLISKKNVDPSQILAVTFSKNAANELIDRLILISDKDDTYKKILYNKKLQKKEKDFERNKYIRKYPWISNISVKTFHGLSYQILRNYGAKEFDNKFTLLIDNSYDEDILSKQISPEKPEKIIEKIIIKNCENPEHLVKLKRYILDYYVDEYKVKMHKLGYSSYQNPYTTLKGDYVKSKSERDIADWLFRHYINYKYEPIIAPGNFEFRPDFFIEEANLYLELVSAKSYPLKDKEKEMIEAGKTYIKIQEHETHDTNEFNKIMDKIVFTRIDRDLRKISPLIFSEEFKGYEKFLKQFIYNLISVIDKIKVEDRKFEEIYQNAMKDEHIRIRDFYEFFKIIFYDYKNYCINHSYLDFNDLLIRTISLLDNYEDIKKLFKNKYKYVLVDEFQDVNSLQVRLIKQLLNDKTQLFCVGDDWQSIYGWRGSDIEYIVNFKKYFNDPKIIKLDTNYRSNETIVNASNEVIKNNKYKIDKEVISFNKKCKKIYLYCAKKECEDGVETVIENIKRILENGYDKEDILVLTRTRKSEAYENYYSHLKNIGVKITTIHQTKGLEAKVVFIIGLTGGFLGFPYLREVDRIFQIIKKTNIEHLMEEERRLFYVAMTRAKEELFLISEVGNESEFIKEIPGIFLERTNFFIVNINNIPSYNCEHCGYSLEESFRFCPHCGAFVGSDNYLDEIKHYSKENNCNSEIKYKAYDVEQIRIEYPKAYEKWTEEEDNLLKIEYNNGKNINELSKLFQRKKGAITSRLNKLGMMIDKN